jgi:Lon protease-like protein
MFPLGLVLMPTQPLPLHVFELRYRQLLHELTAPDAVRELGVVLIERGHEVGGGDQRVGTGTVARLLDARQVPDGRWRALFVGVGRLRVVEWLPDDPYPQAEIEDLAEPEWDPEDQALLDEADELVRESVALAAELGEPGVPADLRFAEDPVLRVWQLCAVAPLGPWDRQRLLEAPRRARLTELIEVVADAKRILAFRLGGR